MEPNVTKAPIVLHSWSRRYTHHQQRTDSFRGTRKRTNTTNALKWPVSCIFVKISQLWKGADQTATNGLLWPSPYKPASVLHASHLNVSHAGENCPSQQTLQHATTPNRTLLRAQHIFLITARTRKRNGVVREISSTTKFLPRDALHYHLHRFFLVFITTCFWQLCRNNT